MILDRLDRWNSYATLNKGFTEAFRFLRRPDLGSLPDGKHPVDGTRIYASIEHRDGRGKPASPIEFHRKYIDIQYVVSGVDIIGWKSLADCNALTHPYDANRDIGFYADAPDFWMSITPGVFAVFFPEDAHAPLAGEGPIHKVVMKVATE